MLTHISAPPTQATDDPYYLDIGRSVVENLEKYAWVPCGYAAFSDLKRSSHEDRSDEYIYTVCYTDV